MTQTDNRIAICGAQTALAKSYTRILMSYGLQVKAISDSDFTRPIPDLAAKLEGCLAVCNISSIPLVSRWTSRSMFDMFSNRMGSLRAFKKALTLCQDPPKTFIDVSNAMQYDQFEVHDDFSTVYGDTFFAELGQMETRCTLEISKALPQMRIIIARMGFLMCKNSGAFPIIQRLSTMRLGGVIGDGYQCLPVIHVSDAARALFRFTTDVYCKGIYNLTTPELASVGEFVAAFRKRQFAAPHFIVKFLAGQASALLEQNCKVVPTRLLQEGFTFDFTNIDSIVANLTGRKK